ncbi:MAG: trypsin-like peptidase domain-containing protein [Myxococcota bacterium]
MMWLLGFASIGFGQDWTNTLEAVKPAVVSIQVNATRSFDTNSAGFSYATGFIVDAENGIILTNRHVVTPGPVVADAVLLNNEEVSLTPIYRDPVHDFGFYRFDPDEVQFLDLVELELAPEAARIDTEVRIIGNDAGEKGAILRGTLSRLDRPAPVYGRGRYNDFNTFYIQSASGTSGGSSGSPVLNIKGQVIALNAGSKRTAASSYFLPLDRVERALGLIQAGLPVTRGTLHATMTQLPYDELERRGLPEDVEARMRQRFPDTTGLLVVDKLVPAGAADGILRPGDILVGVQQAPLAAFVPLEAALDDNVGRPLSLQIVRSGVEMSVEVDVADLHASSPDSYLEIGGGIVNDLSYQKARTYGLPMEGVFVASTGYALSRAGVLDSAIIIEVDGMPTPTVKDFEDIMAAVPEGEAALVRYFHPNNPSRQFVFPVEPDREWFPMQRCTLDPETGLWPCAPSPSPPPPPDPQVVSTTFRMPRDRVARKLAPSLVMIDFDIPFRASGVYGATFRGAGLVVDAEQGLVACDRDTVPIRLGEVMLTFASAVQVPAEVVWLHPEHNVALLRYDPALLGDTPIKSARLNTEPLHEGDTVWQIGLGADETVVARKTTIERRRPTNLPLPRTPFFRDSNLALFDLESVVPSVGGVLTDKKGRVQATWASFVDLSDDPSAGLQGMPARVLKESINSVNQTSLQTLGVELLEVNLADARRLGLPETDAQMLDAHDDARRILAVSRLRAGAPAVNQLRAGDLILTINDQPATRFAEVEAASRGERVRVEVFRAGERMTLEVPTMPLSTQGVERVVSWAGALLHETPPWVAIQRGVEAKGVYVSWYWYGGPAARYGLRGTRRIIAVDGADVNDLDAFLEQVRGRRDREAIELTTKRLDGRVEVLTLRLDLEYWPTAELTLGANGWVRREQ